MPITKISDVIVPELFNPYVVNRTMELSDFFQKWDCNAQSRV